MNMLDEDILYVYTIPIVISIIIFILLIERNPKEEKDKYIEYLHNKTSLTIKLSFLIAICLVAWIGLFGQLFELVFYKTFNNDYIVLVVGIIYWLCCVIGISSNFVSMIYSVKMIIFNSKFEIRTYSLLFHILICLINLFVPIIALYELYKQYF